eukprot:9124755-Karenia_brevis.AAC.1
MQVRGPTPEPVPASQRGSKKLDKAKDFIRAGVKDWVEAISEREGEAAAKHQVAGEVAKQMIAQELVARAQKLQCNEVELGVPHEIVEEAAGSSMDVDHGG